MLRLQSPGDGGPPPVPLVRGPPLRHIHGGHAGHPSASHLERRDGNRAAEKGGGPLGEEVPLEKHTGGLRQVFRGLVLAVRPAHAQVEVRELSVLRVNDGNENGVYYVFFKSL